LAPPPTGPGRCPLRSERSTLRHPGAVEAPPPGNPGPIGPVGPLRQENVWKQRLGATAIGQGRCPLRSDRSTLRHPGAAARRKNAEPSRNARSPWSPSIGAVRKVKTAAWGNAKGDRRLVTFGGRGADCGALPDEAAAGGALLQCSNFDLSLRGALSNTPLEGGSEAIRLAFRRRVLRAACDLACGI
jgi:hypothetical protein